MQDANAIPSPWLRRIPIVLVLVLAAFGALVEVRSCFIERRMGDLTVFVRTAWAVRSGEDIYDVADEKGFHYQYAPLLAILMTPLADPPAGVDRTWVLPYPVIAAAWYVLNVFFLAIAVHWLASALEEHVGGSTAGPRSRDGRWWWLRLGPVLVCLLPIGHTLMRGQVNLLLLLLLCGMATATLRGRRLQSGLWLAGAICLKLIPAFLLLYPLVRPRRPLPGGVRPGPGRGPGSDPGGGVRPGADGDLFPGVDQGADPARPGSGARIRRATRS